MRNASRTFPFVRSYQRVVRSTNLTLERSEVFLWRERRATVGAWPPEPPAAVPTCSLVAGSTHALAFCRGRCGRSPLGGTRLSIGVYRLPPRDIKQRHTCYHCAARKERRILGDFQKYSRVFRAFCVVARDTFRHQIFAFGTKFSSIGVGTKNLSRIYTCDAGGS
jgi:hypothetical protein